MRRCGSLHPELSIRRRSTAALKRHLKTSHPFTLIQSARKKKATFARDAVAERLLVVERQAGVAVASGRIAAADALVRPGRVAWTTVDVVTVARALGHHRQMAHRVVLLRTTATNQSQTADFAPGFYTARCTPPTSGSATHVFIAKNCVYVH